MLTNSLKYNLKTNKMQRQASFRVPKGADLHTLLAGGFGFNSVHVLVNKSRTQVGRKALKRNAVLDSLCQLHAKLMAGDSQVFHSVQSIDELRDLVNSEHAGETVQSGDSTLDMHMESLRTKDTAFKNIMGKDFTEFGAATAKGKDGKLYMVQLFRGATKIESEPVFDLSDMSLPDLEEKQTKVTGATECETTECETMSLEDRTDSSSFTEGDTCVL